MTSNSYLIAKMFASLGFSRKTKRLTDASAEAHLLMQAEALLGIDVWAGCESVEGLSVEYWTLRKLNQKKEDLQLRLTEAKKNLDGCSDQHMDVLAETSEIDASREEEHHSLVLKLKELSMQRAEVVSSAHVLRRKIESSQTKIEVLSKHAQEADRIKEEKVTLTMIINTFNGLKVARDKTSAEMSEISERIKSLEVEIAKAKSGLKERASSLFQNISDANRVSSEIVSEIGLVDVEMQGYYAKVGHYFRQNIKSNPDCSKIAQKHKLIISQMTALAKSILLNHKIAMMSSGN